MKHVVTFEVPIRLVNGSNSRAHNIVKAKLAKKQRQEFVTFVQSMSFTPFVRFHLPKPPRTYAIARWEPPYSLPLVITITRLAARRMDDDGAVTSAKHVRDQLAELLGINDNDSRVEWRVKQETRRTPGVRVTLEAP